MMNNVRNHSFLYIGPVFFIVCAIWGFNPPAMKVGLQYLPPVPYNAARMTVAMIVALIAFALSRSYRPFARSDYVRIFALSVFGFFVNQLFVAVGIQRTTSGNASFILSILPVIVVIINRIFNIEKITKPVIVGIAFSIAGIILLVLGSEKELSLSDRHLSGALFLLAAQIGYGYYTVFSGTLLYRYSVYQVFAAIITITTFLFLLVSAPFLGSVDWKNLPLAAWISILYSGIFAMTIGNFIWIWGIGKIGSVKASIFSNLSPVFAVIGGYVLLGETFGPLQVAGAAGIFFGIWITRNREKLSGHEILKP
jgi:drug/metabolite transporter (DMT)-like permease